MEPIFWIVLLSVIGPVIGSFIGIIKKPSKRMMFHMLSFAGGVMLAISFLELIPESIDLSSHIICITGVFAGAMIMFTLDKLLPHIHPELCTDNKTCTNLRRTASYLIIGIFLHNFPEGMAIAMGGLSDVKVSLAIAFAIAIHNIPEGICTSAPYYYCTKKKFRSFLISSTTALPIVIGFLISYYLFRSFPSSLLGFIVGGVAGLMIYISIDELIPSSCSKITNHKTIFSFILGVILVVLLGLI